MKVVEEAFAGSGFRRVVLPGIVLAAGIHPIFSDGLKFVAAVYGLDTTVLLITEVVFFGLLVSSWVKQIYYLFEGFRLPQLTAWGLKRQRKKLSRLEDAHLLIQGERSFDELNETEKLKVYKIDERLQEFPLRRNTVGSPEQYVDRPTRLGNIIATYELYPKTRYGIDGIDFWQHLLSFAPESARESFDEQYAFAESLLLASFSGAVVTIIHAIVLVGFLIGLVVEPIKIPTGPLASAILMTIGAASWWLFYCSALTAHAEAGSYCRAAIDLAIPEFVNWAKKAQAPLQSDALQNITKLQTYLRDLN